MAEEIIRPKKIWYYAVRKGRQPGVYTDVEEYRKQVDGFTGSKSRKFNNQRDAENFVKGLITATEIQEKQHKDFKAIKTLSKENRNDWVKVSYASTIASAYVDGSFDHTFERCGYGVVIVRGDGRKILLNGCDIKAAETELNNVASEMLACRAALEWAMENRMRKLVIVTDQQYNIDVALSNGLGLSHFERIFFDKYKHAQNRGIEVLFKKIKAHVGNEFNELADALARLALKKEIKKSLSKKINIIGVKNWEHHKEKPKKKTCKKEDYSQLHNFSIIYRIKENRNIEKGEVVCLYKSEDVLQKLTAVFDGKFMDINASELGTTVFLSEENAKIARQNPS